MAASRTCYSSCAGFQSVSKSPSKSWEGVVHKSGVHGVVDDCRLMSDVDRRRVRWSLNDVRMQVVPRTHNRFSDRSTSTAGP